MLCKNYEQQSKWVCECDPTILSSTDTVAGYQWFMEEEREARINPRVYIYTCTELPEASVVATHLQTY